VLNRQKTDIGEGLPQDARSEVSAIVPYPESNNRAASAGTVRSSDRNDDVVLAHPSRALGCRVGSRAFRVRDTSSASFATERAPSSPLIARNS
jgi:hypothetical protein